jgi:hypothetical protein
MGRGQPLSNHARSVTPFAAAGFRPISTQSWVMTGSASCPFGIAGSRTCANATPGKAISVYKEGC